MSTTHDKPAPQTVDQDARDMANAIRALTMDAVQKANSGHPGMPMGMADVASVLFRDFVKIDPSNPTWPDRDRFILSAGHGSMLLYAVHHLLGYSDMDIDQLKSFRQIGSRTAGQLFRTNLRRHFLRTRLEKLKLNFRKLRLQLRLDIRHDIFVSRRVNPELGLGIFLRAGCERRAHEQRKHESVRTV